MRDKTDPTGPNAVSQLAVYCTLNISVLTVKWLIHRSAQSIFLQGVRGSFRGSRCSFPNSAPTMSQWLLCFPLSLKMPFRTCMLPVILGNCITAEHRCPPLEKLDCLNTGLDHKAWGRETVIVIYWYWAARKNEQRAHTQRHRMREYTQFTMLPVCLNIA